jgi:hypothetical protein
MSAAIRSILYARKDAGITLSGCEPDRREILIRIMEISGNNGSEDRIASLEKRLQEMDALVHGLIAELLDLKAVSTTLTRQTEERSRQDLARGPALQGTAPSTLSFTQASSDGHTVIRSEKTQSPAVPAEPEMVRIMQADGTMKMEARYGENRIDSSMGYGKNKRGAASMSKQNPLILAAEDDKPADSKK